MGYAVELVADEGNLCGEGPIWDYRRQRLLWTDADAAALFEIAGPGAAVTAINPGMQVASIALTEGDSLLLAGSTGIHLWRGPADYTTIVSERDGQRLVFNDMIAGPSGCVYAGTYYWDENGLQKTGRLYRLDPDGTLSVMDEGFLVSNGLGFSPDATVLYFADSGARRIYSYDVNARTGDLTNRREFVRVPADEGIPDGLTVDADGFVWSAQWYGAQVVRYDPEGKVERRLAMPVAQVSSVTFGGPDLTDLYVTSAAAYWPSEYVPRTFDRNGPLGGALYRIRPGVAGRREFLARF